MKPSDIDSHFILQNNTPLDVFCGLTPNEMHHLCYYPFDEKSPMHFRNDIGDSTLDRIPFFRIAEEFLKLVHREKQIKLTLKGALPKAVLVELYGHKLFLERHIESGIVKLWREENSVIIMTARLTTEVAKLVKKSKNKISITKSGLKLLLPENRFELFKTIFNVYTTKFNWGFNDRYTEQPVGQLGFGFSLYLLDKFGEELQPASFYSDKYLKAFPKFLDFFPERQYSTGVVMFNHCFYYRTFDNFLEWFGLITIDRSHDFLRKEGDKIKETGLFKQVFVFD